MKVVLRAAKGFANAGVIFTSLTWRAYDSNSLSSICCGARMTFVLKERA